MLPGSEMAAKLFGGSGARAHCFKGTGQMAAKLFGGSGARMASRERVILTGVIILTVARGYQNQKLRLFPLELSLGE